jgi:predicted anti-sigma-YlaC factor YlaD
MRRGYVRRHLDAYVDHELAKESAALIRDHLRSCAGCRQRVTERAALIRLVRAAPH